MKYHMYYANGLSKLQSLTGKQLTPGLCLSQAAFATRQSNPHDMKEQFWMLILPISQSYLQQKHSPIQFYQKPLEFQHYCEHDVSGENSIEINLINN